MNSKNLALRIAGTLFAGVSLLHLLRIITAINIQIGSCSVPIWMNILGCIATAVLGFWMWKLSFK